MVAQLLFLYGLAGDMDTLDNVVDYELQQANVHLFLRSDHSSAIGKVMESLRETTEGALGSTGLEVEFTGWGQLIHSFNERILNSQVRSALIALVAIYVVTSGVFRSLSAGLFNLIPIVIAVLFNFGLMHLLGIALGISTAMISSIGMGIGIDYAVHFLYRFRVESRKGHDIRQSIQTTMATSGKAIFFNALTVSLGFLVLIVSSFPFVRELGMLLCINMVASYLGATVAIPVLLSWIRPAFIRAGPEPEP